MMSYCLRSIQHIRITSHLFFFSHHLHIHSNITHHTHSYHRSITYTHIHLTHTIHSFSIRHTNSTHSNTQRTTLSYHSHYHSTHTIHLQTTSDIPCQLEVTVTYISHRRNIHIEELRGRNSRI